jgi:hypothetical protein
MADLQKRGYTPRKAREQKAYRMVQVGTIAGVGTVGTGLLAIFGVLGWGIPIILAILTALCVFGFRRVAG